MTYPKRSLLSTNDWNQPARDLAPALTAYVDRLLNYYAGALESVICFSLPFASRQQVLVALAPWAPHVWPAFEVAGPELLKEIDLICLRTVELFQLELPAPDVALSNIPYWVQETGRVLWGRDLRKELRCRSTPGRFLACQLDRVQCERHKFILYLMHKQYQGFQMHISRERDDLMYAALLELGIYQVYPASVGNQFLESYPDPELESNVAEFRSLQVRMREVTEDQQRSFAYKQAWNFEMFLRMLWRYVR